MKLKSTLWALAFACAAVSCSDELEGGANVPDVVDGASGYAKVTITLPSTSGVGTRAYNDVFDDGLGNEWAVKGGIIAYFAGSSESDATFVGAYNLPLGNWNTIGTTTDAITAERTLTVEAPLLEDNAGTVYALVILNPHSTVISLDNNTHSLTINNTEYTVPAGMAVSPALNLAALQAKLANQDIANYTGTNGFTMLNAPLATDAVISTDHDASVEILRPITIYDNESDASANDGTVIHLERVMAKVTLTGFDETTLQMEITGLPTGYTGYAQLEGWTLDVTNKSTKLLHDVTGYGDWFSYYSDANTTQSRFVAAAEPYRIYWSVDGNYDGNGYGTAKPNDPTNTQWGDEFNYIASDAENINWSTTIGSEKPLYCFENTFDVDNMDEDQTTRIVMKGKYYFTQESSGDGATNSNENAEDPSFFVIGSDEETATYTISAFISKVNEKVTSFLDDTWTPGSTVNAGTFDSVEGLATLLGKDATTDATGLQTLLGAFGSVKYYKNAQVFYYVTRIEHFGEELTPWNDEIDGKPYEYTAARHLGRYGVVRNNWYELNITGITGPGEPEIPDTPDTPDDEETGFVKAAVRILAWSKRVQDVTLN